MPFGYNSWTALTVLIVAATIVAAAFPFFRNYTDLNEVTRRKYNKREASALSGCVLAAVVVILAILNGFTAAFSSIPNQNGSTVSDVTGAFGLQNGHAYPLELGSRLGGSEVDMHITGGIFHVTASVTAKPASVLSMSFTNGNGDYYILEIPVSKITFHQSETAQPTVTMHLHNNEYDGADVTSTFSPCRWTMRSVFAVCHTHETSRTTTLAATTKHAGLPPVVEGSWPDGTDNLDNADVILTPDMYQKVLGGS